MDNGSSRYAGTPPRRARSREITPGPTTARTPARPTA
jgi:hypothetical protein